MIYYVDTLYYEYNNTMNTHTHTHTYIYIKVENEEIQYGKKTVHISY